jgi:hypothetical protein
LAPPLPTTKTKARQKRLRTTVAKLSLYVAEQGNARVETHRAFTEAEFRKLLSEID